MKGKLNLCDLPDGNFYLVLLWEENTKERNENLIRNVPSIGTPASNWKYEQQVLNCWIKQQRFWIDVTPRMTDKNGRLKAEMTTDGLHPDLEGKKIIGEMVSEYLLKTFPYLDLTEK